MKTLITILILTATIATAGEYANVLSNKYYPAIPKRIQATQNPTAAQLAARGIYPTTRKPLPEGHRYLTNDFRLENGRAVDYTPTIDRAEEWAANNQKGTQQLEWEQQLTNDVAIAFNGATPPYSEAAYANLQVQAAAKRLAAREVVATADLTTAQGRATFNAALAQYHRIHAIESRIKLLQDAFPSFQITNNSTIGRQPTTGDYPQ